MTTQNIAKVFVKAFRKVSEKSTSARLTNIGIWALLLMCLVLSLSFILDIESNTPLCSALVLMVAGVALTVAGMKKSSGY